MCWFIIVQMGAISLYTICAIEFLARYHLNKPVRHSLVFTETSDIDTRAGARERREAEATNSPVAPGGRKRIMDTGVKLMLVGMAISTLFILIRSVYRTIELLDGWTGRIITTQLYFVRITFPLPPLPRLRYFCLSIPRRLDPSIINTLFLTLALLIIRNRTSSTVAQLWLQCMLSTFSTLDGFFRTTPKLWEGSRNQPFSRKRKRPKPK